MRSERLRASLLCVIWIVALVSTVMRHALGGTVMGVGLLYYWAVAILSFAVLFEFVAIVELTRHVRSGKPVPRWKWITGAIIDLAIPVAMLLALHVYSPVGSVAALSAPALLGIPLVTMLSILRLRPGVTLLTGLAGAAVHAALTADAIAGGGVDSHLWPMLFSYSVFLGVVGVGAWMLARQMRANVTEAVGEAVAAEQRQRELDAIEHDLNVAREIQRGLMPAASPSLAGFDIAGMARPAQHAGGDYYDWQPLPDGRLLVVLADVTGHGIGPALVMAVCRAYARATAPSAEDSAALLRRVNALIFEDLAQTGRFITMVTAILSPDGTVELVSAGHGPTLLYRAGDGAIESFGGDGVPLGINLDESYSPHSTLRMAPGDVLLLATDGFVEWQRDGGNGGDERKEQFGAARLGETFRDAAAGSAQSVLERLDAAVQAFAGGTPQQDDTTAVVIKRA